MLYAVSSSEGGPAKLQSSLRPQGISSLLAQYPDQRFVENLVGIAEYGACVGYEGGLVRVRRPNHSSAYTHMAVVSESIQSELTKGRIMELTLLPKHYYCSPIGLVPKKTDGIQTGWRMIFDLSCPEFNSVNDGIPKEYGAIIYETLQDAMQLVAKAGVGAIMIKRDLKSAFRHIPLCIDQYWLFIFEWEDRFYVDMFLPFGLRTAPRIFNLFSEALHWIFEFIHGWSVTHYLDDFFFVFPPGTTVPPIVEQYNSVLTTIGLTGAPEKDMSGTVVTHLGFEFNSQEMNVRLPVNKHSRALQTVKSLLAAKSVTYAMLDEALGFLSHCCQVVPLGRPFIRNMFSVLRRIPSSRRLRTRLSTAAKKDLQWWLLFLSSWSTISVIQPSRVNHDVATDASGKKGIGGVYNSQIFSNRVPARHRDKHINWKEMFAILHAFTLWHSQWATGRVRIACDNEAVVGGVNKRSIDGPALRPLQMILLLAALFDIEIKIFWIPSKENIVADAASRHQFDKLADLGFQESLQQKPVKISSLRQKLHSFFKVPLHPKRDRTTTRPVNLMKPSVDITAIDLSLRQSSQSLTGSPSSCRKSNQLLPKDTSNRSVSFTTKTATAQRSSTILVSNSSFEGANASTAKAIAKSDSLSPTISYSKLQGKSKGTISKASASKVRSVWHLPDSYDVVSLRGKPGISQVKITSSPENMSSSTSMAPSPSPSHHQKQIPFEKAF